MPGLVAFGRRWSFGSDDLFPPCILLCFIHSIWLIVTIVALVIDIDEFASEKGKETCGPYILEMIISITLLLSIGLVLEIFLTIVSMRGSILYDAPRKSAQYLIYILLGILCIKLMWTGFGVAWIHQFYFQCSILFSKQVILGLVICTWFVFLSILITTWCTFDGAGKSWVKMKRYQANMKEFELKYPSYKRSGTLARNWRQRKVIRAYQDSWDHRCRLLFCCIHNNERNRDSFTELAKLLSEFFRDLDVVPTDVVVALVLLRRLQRLEQCSIVKQKRNHTYEFLSGIAITPKTRFVAMNDPKDLETFRNVVHYMHYASAAYGWPWYVIPNGVMGVCRLCAHLQCGCRQRSDLAEVIVEDNCCYCNYAVIPTVFDPGTFEVIFATYHVDVAETPFFVVVSYEKQAVVVSIRGTLSLKDVITDLNAEGEHLPVDPPREDWIGHKGILHAAEYMKSKLIGEKILEKAFTRAAEHHTPDAPYQLVLVGHSLGAGTAAILAVLLKDQFPNLHCYAFSPPGGLLSMPVVEYTKEFVTTIIVGKDLVPRIGLSQMEALRTDLINAMKKSHKPKWQTLMSGIACCSWCVKPEFAMPQRLSSAPSIQSEEFMRTRRSLKDLREVTINPNESAIALTVHQPLYPPGRIMHIVRHHPTKDEVKYESVWKRVIKKGEPVFQALWTENTDYGQVLISPGMIQDHMPDQVLRALHRVVTNPGPAKPQRRLASSQSPLTMSRDSLLGEVSRSNRASPHRLCMETSFTNSATPKPSPECTLLKPGPLIADADAEIENDEDLTPMNDLGFRDLLSTLNLNWDYITTLQGTFPGRGWNFQRHERSTSIGNASSSGCSETGSTFKEIFGPMVRYEDWMAPLASPETLSEISSLGSRASFFLPKDQSPLLRMKGRNGNSCSLHRQHHRNGKTNAISGNNSHHNRSSSCTYPERNEVAIIGSAFYSGKKPRLVNNGSNGGEEIIGNEIHGDENGKFHFDEGSEGFEDEYSPPKHKVGHRNSSPAVSTQNSSPAATDDQRSNNRKHSAAEPQVPAPTAKRVSFNLKRKHAAPDTDSFGNASSFHDHNAHGASSSSQASASGHSSFDPTYPIFSHQEEYGVPSLNSPHYTYCGQSPIDSPSVVFSSPTLGSRRTNTGPEKFQFPDFNDYFHPTNPQDETATTTCVITTEMPETHH